MFRFTGMNLNLFYLKTLFGLSPRTVLKNCGSRGMEKSKAVNRALDARLDTLDSHDRMFEATLIAVSSKLPVTDYLKHALPNKRQRIDTNSRASAI
jgi:hypothetical protein